jgi:uncharacterized protein (TIGR03437 family)
MLTAVCLIGCCFTAFAQLSSSAYRVLGQPDMQRNVRNQIGPAELRSPYGLAMDHRDGLTRLYVTDSNNNRVLAWSNALSAARGEPADFILGQPDAFQAVGLGVSGRQLGFPTSIAVDPNTGDLYVADTGANRVVRFKNPFDQQGASEANAVFGQTSFTTITANTGGLSASSMRTPRSVAVDAGGNLWVSDSDNNRVLRYPGSALAAGVRNPAADLVLGQADFSTATANRGGLSASSLRGPSGLAFDGSGRLYVCDTGNARVLIFNPPFTNGQPAVSVLGQANFTSAVIPATPSANSLRQPTGVAFDPNLNLVYVTSPVDQRVLVYRGIASGTAPADALGQPNLTSFQGNQGTAPRAGASGFLDPFDVKVDPVSGRIFVADTSNNRVVAFDRGAKEAAGVWGQADFTLNSPNRIKPESIAGPAGIVIDYSAEPYALYVSDAQNHRVLGWRDSIRFHDGQPADIVIGQPDFYSAIPNVDTPNQTPTATSLSGPRGLAVDSIGTLYVADAGNNRVLRFPRPVSQEGRITSDLVVGQPDFESSSASIVAVNTLRTPTALAIAFDDSLLVADTGNNRVLEFPNGSTSAIRVFGQPSFGSAAAPSAPTAQTLSAPQGIAVDIFSAVYIADTGANRVLVYTNTRDADAGLSAEIVIGQPNLSSNVAGTGANRLRSPVSVSVDRSGRVFIADNGNNRVLQFPSLLLLQPGDSAAESVFGQPNMTSAVVNYNSRDGQATPDGIGAPLGLCVDRMNTLYVGDTSNNRVIHVLQRATVANAANPATTAVARGSLAWIQGLELTDGSSEVSAAPLPKSLAGREVIFNSDLAAPLQSASQTRFVLQIPSETPTGSQRFAVRSSISQELVAGGAITVNAYAPAVFTVSKDGRGQAVAINEDLSENRTGLGAAKGSIVTVMGTGHGPLQSAVADGELGGEIPTLASPTADLARCLTAGSNLVCVAMGSVAAEVVSSTLAPDQVGVWTLKLKVPSNLVGTGNVPIRVVINGSIASNLPTIVVR